MGTLWSKGTSATQIVEDFEYQAKEFRIVFGIGQSLRTFELWITIERITLKTNKNVYLWGERDETVMEVELPQVYFIV